jgi:hypothetical protein
VSKPQGPFGFNTPERRALMQALENVPAIIRRSFYRRFANFENAYALRMKWAQENAATDDAAREIWTAFVKERLK